MNDGSDSVPFFTQPLSKQYIIVIIGTRNVELITLSANYIYSIINRRMLIKRKYALLAHAGKLSTFVLSSWQTTFVFVFTLYSFARINYLDNFVTVWLWLILLLNGIYVATKFIENEIRI